MAAAYEVIVVGLGAMGSATVAHLARRGSRVLGLDTFQPCHERGSSHGKSRIIREAYFEAPDYVPLVQRAYNLWRELEKETGRSLLTITGGLNIGEPEGDLVRGAMHSAQLHALPYEVLTADETAARFPAFRPPEHAVAVYEPRAGVLQPEACIGAHLDVAAAHGADLHFAEEALRWAVDGEGVRIETAHATYQAASMVITTGPWVPELLDSLSLPLRVERVVVAHFEPQRPRLFTPDRCPVAIWQLSRDLYYSFPLLPDQGIKTGRHGNGETCTPRTIRRTVDGEEVEAVRHALKQVQPEAGGPLLRTVTCMYTNTVDAHFIVDRHPLYPQVSFACGFSGHGFKFASTIGEVMADLALEGATSQVIDFLSLRRFTAAQCG